MSFVLESPYTVPDYNTLVLGLARLRRLKTINPPAELPTVPCTRWGHAEVHEFSHKIRFCPRGSGGGINGAK